MVNNSTAQSHFRVVLLLTRKLRQLIFLCVLGALSAALALPAHAAPTVSARSAILVSADTGAVLFERNADEQSLIASTTKIMTAIVVLEHCEPDEKVTVDTRSAGIEGSSMYLRAGDTYTVAELLYGMMLVSGNDAATALAIHTAGDIESFADLMNEKAAELGMTGSAFRNPHGLDEEGHYSTARDLAVLAVYCMKNEEFEKIVATRSITVGEQTLVNHNRLLGSYDGCIGLKTGYTEAAGRSLVSCAQREGTRYVCVTLGDPNDWDDHAALYDWAFAGYRYVTVVSARETFALPVISGEAPAAAAAVAEDVRALVPMGTVPDVSVDLPRFVFAPVAAGEGAGTVTVRTECGETVTGTLVFTDDVPLQKGIRLTPWERFARVWTMAGRPYYLTGEKHD